MVYTAALVIGRGAPRLSGQGSVAEMIRSYLFHLRSADKASSARRGSVDSSDEREKQPAISAKADYGLDDEQRLLQKEMAQQLERCLSEAKGSALRCQVLLLPCQMSARVAGDVVRSSAEEPCGLRGASITVFLGTEDGPKPLGTILPDPSVTPTFELSVVFKADDQGWSPFKHMFVTSEVLKLRPEYRLVKRKLYSSASPIIHDFY